MNMTRIMGLDYGSKTVGVAVSDSLGITAQGIETITRNEEGKLRRTLARIEELSKEYSITRIVLGYPKNMDNSAGERVKKTEEFAAMVERRTGIPVVGVAVSDSLGITAQGIETITRNEEGKLRRTLARIEELSKEYSITRIVLGYPKNMDNSAGERVKKTEEFAAMVERRTGIPVVFWDERLSTVSAERVLMESKVRREKRKAVIDKIAAVFILQNYLDSGTAGTESDPDQRQEREYE